MLIVGILLDRALQHPRHHAGFALRSRALQGVILLHLTLSPVWGQGGEEPDTLAVRLQRLLLELRREPRSGEVYLGLAEAYRERGNLVAARASAEEGLRLGLAWEDSSRAILILADVAFQQGRSREGARRLERLLERDSASPDAMVRLAQLRWDDHFRAEALVLGMEAASRDPSSVEKRRWLAERWKEMGRPELALALWEGLAAEGRAGEEDLFQIGFLLQRLDRAQRALDVYLELLDRNPRHTEANYNLSLLLLAVGDTAGAAQRLERAIQASPDLQRAYLDLATIYMRGGQITKARRVLIGFCANARPDSITSAHVREILRSLAEVSADR